MWKVDLWLGLLIMQKSTCFNWVLFCKSIVYNVIITLIVQLTCIKN